MWVIDSQRQWRKQRRGNKYNKDDNLLSCFTSACVKFVVAVFVSSSRWVMSVAGMVESKGSSRTIIAGSWCRSSHWMQLVDRCGNWGRSSCWSAAGPSLREAGVGRVVKVQMDDRCGKLVSVESVNTAGRSLRVAEVGRSW